MSVASDLAKLEREIQKLSPDGKEAVRLMLDGIFKLIGEKDVEDAIPMVIKNLAGDLIMTAMTSYGLRGADKTRKIFREGLAETPYLVSLIPSHVFK